MSKNLHIAVAATFTAEPVAESIIFWGDRIGRPCDVRFAAYNQVFQALLDPSGVFLGNASAEAVILVRPEDWLRHAHDTAVDSKRKLIEAAQELIAAIQTFSRLRALLVVVCPASPEHGDQAKEAEDLVLSALGSMAGVAMIAPADLAALYPVADAHDRHGDELGHVPFTREFFAALGSAVMRKVVARSRPPFKVIAVDCDNTLWSGVCGEVGPHGIVLTPENLFLQQFLVEQSAQGKLICLSSKNREEDVFAVFAAHPEMPLRREHVVAHRINWEPKSRGLQSIANELNLGIDSFIFIDDNPVEIAEVAAVLPQVLGVELPPGPEQIALLRHIWAFDTFSVTAEDRNRAASYIEETEREKVRQRSGGFREFLEQLALEIEIVPLVRDALPRAAQLTQRTNQFNVSGTRRDEAAIRKLVDAGEFACLTVSVRDRFGDYGMVGLVIYRLGEALEIDTFLMSCRVLGRTVERRVIKRLAQTAREQARASVSVRLVPTDRNQPAQDFLRSLPATSVTDQADASIVFTFSAAALEALPDIAEAETVSAVAAPSIASATKAEPSHTIDFIDIATSLSTSRQILDAITQSRLAAHGSANSQDTHGSPVEEQIAAVWSEVLGVPAPGLDEDFFAIGGDSLLGTQVISRLRNLFDVPLPLSALFEAPTVTGLAVAVLHALAEREQEDEVDGFLDGIEDPVKLSPQ